jgi:hypothetical protein
MKVTLTIANFANFIFFPSIVVDEYEYDMDPMYPSWNLMTFCNYICDYIMDSHIMPSILTTELNLLSLNNLV